MQPPDDWRPEDFREKALSLLVAFNRAQVAVTEVKASNHEMGKSPGYSYTLPALQALVRRSVTDCTLDDAAARVIELDTARREARIRVERGHTDGQTQSFIQVADRLDKRLKTLGRVVTLQLG